MSSILKALKKIEENSPSPELQPSLPNPLDTNQLLDSNIKNRRHRRRFLFLCLILVLLAGTTALLFNHRQMLIAKVSSILSSESPTADEASNPVSANVYKAKVPTSSVKPVTKPPAATRQRRKPIKKTVPGSTDKKFQTSTKSANGRRISEPLPPQKSPRSRSTQAVADSRIKKPPDLEKASASPGLQSARKPVAGKKSKPIAPVTSTKQAGLAKTRTTYRPIENDKLKLQALAWSDDAARRMAVINGRIVHEGDSVDGYQILKIREEEVIVNESGKSWSLEFGLRQ